MRIALYGHQSLGVRIARVLLAEPHLEKLGIVGEKVRHPRVEQVKTVGEYNVVVIDCLDDRGWSLFEEALAHRTDVVLIDQAPDIEPPPAAVVADAASPRLLAHALAHPERGAGGDRVEVEIAWTVEGRLLRSGEPVNFPDPIGSRWAGKQPVSEPDVHRALAAPGPGPWMGALAKVTTMTEVGLRTTVTAVVDDAEFLTTLMVAGAAVAAAEGAYGSGVIPPADPGGTYLRALARAGLNAATFTRA